MIFYSVCWKEGSWNLLLALLMVLDMVWVVLSSSWSIGIMTDSEIDAIQLNDS